MRKNSCCWPGQFLILAIILFLLAACTPGGIKAQTAPEPQATGETKAPRDLPPTATPEPPPMFAGDPIPSGWPAYTNTELGYTLRYPSDWKVNEYGLTQLNKEVIFSSPEVKDFQSTLTVALDERSLEQIQQVYRENVTDAVRSETMFAGEPAIQYSYSWPHLEIYIQHAGKVYVVLTDETGSAEVRQSIGSFRFTK